MPRTSRIDGLAWVATALAAVASAAGLFTNVYRDVAPMVDQARGTDLATLFGAVPALVFALRAAHRGSPTGRVVVVGALAYLIYTYAIYGFQVVVSPVTPLHIAVLGFATWSVVLMVPTMGRAVAVGGHLRRRTTSAFLGLVVVMFAALWIGQIMSIVTSGALPSAITDLHLPTSAVYPLDLAFALPLLGLAAYRLGRGLPFGAALALGGLVFATLMALSILGLSLVQQANGSLGDPSMSVGFGAIAVIAAVLAGRGLVEPDHPHAPEGHALEGHAPNTVR